tara:strand:+ start:335 stop:577 length:243 start_codon:yes stop_codon:yes gene_type:complete
MIFMIPVNEAEPNADGEMGSVTFDRVDTGSFCARTNKRKLHDYLIARGVPRKNLKRTMKGLGFTGAILAPTQVELNRMGK